MKYTNENPTLYILDEQTAGKLNDMLYKLIDAYWEILHFRQIDLPGKLDFGLEEVEFYDMRAKIKSSIDEMSEDHF